MPGCLFDRFKHAVIMFVPQTQPGAHERSDDEMSIDEDFAMHFPGVPVTRLDSDCFDAREQLLDAVYVARDGASVRSASQRADVTALMTSAVTVTLCLHRDLE